MEEEKFRRREVMTGEDLYNAFKEMFPGYAEKTIAYKKIGSRTLSILTEISDKTFVFLYISDDNWQFGTKLWRKRPDKVSSRYHAEHIAKLNGQED